MVIRTVCYLSREVMSGQKSKQTHPSPVAYAGDILLEFYIHMLMFFVHVLPLMPMINSHTINLYPNVSQEGALPRNMNLYQLGLSFLSVKWNGKRGFHEDHWEDTEGQSRAWNSIQCTVGQALTRCSLQSRQPPYIRHLAPSRQSGRARPLAHDRYNGSLWLST